MLASHSVQSTIRRCAVYYVNLDLTPVERGDHGRGNRTLMYVMYVCMCLTNVTNSSFDSIFDT